jgi:UDP-N-acetylmuramate dehydrogenase
MPGPAALSTKHCLAVTNRGSATAADVVSLAREIRDGVHDTFAVSLVSEPVLVGISL